MSDDDDIPIVNIDNFSGPFLVWAEDKSVQQEIKRIFRRFLKTFEDANENAVYAKAVRKMCRENRASLEVDYNHIGQSIQNIAIWLADYPERILVMLDAALQDVVEEAFPGYSRIQNTVHVRIMNLPIEDKLRELRHMHLGRLIRCFGVATKRTSVIPQLVTVRFNCVKCNYLTFPFAFLGDEKMGSPDRCGECGSKGPFRVNTKETIYRNYQRITLQESPGSVPAGRVPRRKEVILSNDLIDSVRPGEEIGVTGIYRNRFEMTLNTRVGFPVFKTEIEANHVQKTKQQFIENLTEEDKEQIRNFAKKQNIYEIIINSIAPSIHGHRFVKEALAMALFGGTAKEVDKSRHRLRGDINILILGDPGTAKSQFLKYLEKSAPRAVYSTGKGASGVGLTASVQRDAKTREWTLEGGALVLADQGMCLIDEFDKMNDHDRFQLLKSELRSTRRWSNKRYLFPKRALLQLCKYF